MPISKAEVRDYFNSRVDIGYGNSADFVVVDAHRKAQRGKGPSVTYRNPLTRELERNPRKALDYAKDDIAKRKQAALLAEQVRKTGQFSPTLENTAKFCGKVAIVGLQPIIIEGEPLVVEGLLDPEAIKLELAETMLGQYGAVGVIFRSDGPEPSARLPQQPGLAQTGTYILG